MLEAKEIAQNAVALLEADHAQVKIWFAQFEKANKKRTTGSRDQYLQRAESAHGIEEEVFIPFLAATKDKNVYRERSANTDRRRRSSRKWRD